MSMTEPAQTQRHGDVELRLPADVAYVSVLRTTAAGLAARLDFTIDEIEDLRIAVSEATALVLPEASDGSDLTCGFYQERGTLTIDLSVSSDEAGEHDDESFAWQVLTTLAHDAQLDRSGGRLRVRLTMRSAVELSP